MFHNLKDILSGNRLRRNEALNFATDHILMRIKLTEDKNPEFVTSHLFAVLGTASALIIGISKYDNSVAQSNPFAFTAREDQNVIILKMYRALSWHYFHIAWKSNDRFGMSTEDKGILNDFLQSALEFDEKDLEYHNLLTISLEQKSEFYFMRLLEWMLDGKTDNEALIWSIVLGSFTNSYSEVYNSLLLQFLAPKQEVAA